MFSGDVCAKPIVWPTSSLPVQESHPHSNNKTLGVSLSEILSAVVFSCGNTAIMNDFFDKNRKSLTLKRVGPS